MKKIVSLFLFFMLLIISVPSYADYKIILKNSREFVVDGYKDLNGKIKFYREGGEFEIDRNNIKEIKKVKAVKRAEESSPTETIKDSAEKSTPPEKSAPDSKLREIAGKKAQLRAEGEKLIDDKKKLEEEIKKQGQVIYLRQERDYKHRISELEEKIERVNEEIKSADKEEKLLLKETGGH